mgnify:CR=1 FL=1
MVMYRDFAFRKARRLGVVGEVWNEDDGIVSLVGEGEEEKLLLFIEQLQKGSFLSRVERVDVVWKAPTGEFTDFHIRYKNL